MIKHLSRGVFGNKSKLKSRRQKGQTSRRGRGLGFQRLDERAVLAAVAGIPTPHELVQSGLAATDLAQSLVGGGVSVSNATLTGAGMAAGSFQFTDPTVIGFNQGIVLSSGNVADVVGPNVADYTSTDHTNPGDADLTALSGFTTYDAVVLEFDFVPTANQVVFQYAFASDEYPEWVNTPFNDVFAFYVNGTNYATVRQVAGDPASPFVPVAVNNINQGNPLDPAFVPTRPDLFRPNYVNPNVGPSALDLELDGITHVLNFQAPVTPGVTNHMKLAIADASDGIYDSAVFIQAGSLVSNANPVADVSLMPLSSATPGLVTAIVEGEDPNGLALTYTISWGDGTYTSGPLDSPSNQSEKTTTTNHSYAADGNYLVTLTISNGVLTGTSVEDVQITGLGGGGGGGGGGDTLAAPVVATNPVDQAVLEGTAFVFTATATGTPTPDIQWQVSVDGGMNFADIAGATGTTYTGVASLADSGNLYQAAFSNSEGEAVTTAALLTVSPLPVDDTPPDAPIVALMDDTGISSTDQITSVGLLAVSGIEDGALVEYSTDGGNNWSDGFLAAEGLNTVQVRQTDAAGNTSDAAILAFVLDTTSPAAPSVTLAEDTGASGTDGVTKNGTVVIGGTEAGAAVEYSADGGTTWTTSFAAVEGLNSVQTRQTDEAGNVSAVASLSFTLDTIAPTSPSVTLAEDTGASGTDGVTKNGTVVIGGTEAGAAVEYSTDGGSTWLGSFAAVEGANSVRVRQTDAAGNMSDTALLSFLLDTAAPAAPSIALLSDTGNSATDGLTKNGTLVIGGTEASAAVEYSTDGGVTWSGGFAAVEGANSVKVRQTDAAGNMSDAALLSFLLDTAVPAAPSIALLSDTGNSATDGLTKNGTLVIGGTEAGAAVEYSIDGGSTWSGSFAAVEGANTVSVRQTDAAGNVSAAASLIFTLDTAAPAAPSLTLTEDTGVSATDGITKVGKMTLTGAEAGAIVEFSGDNGATWQASFTAQEGANAVSVRQTDAAGNASAVGTVKFTLDTTPPQLNPKFSTGSQPILVNAKGVVVIPNATDATGIASQSAGAIDTTAAGKRTVVCTATDLAGNTASVSVPYVVGYQAVNVTPSAGTKVKHTANIPVSFQLRDANGLLSHAAAAKLVGNISITFDKQTFCDVSYDKKTGTFSMNVKLKKPSLGAHTLGIQVVVGGTAVTSLTIPITIV